MLERVAREEVPPDVSARCAVDARHDDEIGVRADDVERIELNAAEPVEQRTRSCCARTDAPVEREVTDQARSRFAGFERRCHISSLYWRGMRSVVVVVAVCASILVGAAPADDLARAEQLAWSKDFAAAETLYRTILRRDPASRRAQLGLARVVLWQGRYPEAIRLFERIEPRDAPVLEGIAQAAYWSGDLRTAARMFRRALALEPGRDASRQALAELTALARPTQRVTVAYDDDDQPLERARVDVEATHSTDPQTVWSIRAGGYSMEAGRIGESDGAFVGIGNETTWRNMTLRAALGLFTYPDGVRRPTGHLGVRRGELELFVEQREALATATALTTHASARTTTLRWRRERAWIAAVEASHRQWFDDNSTVALVAYGVAPILRRGPLTLWAGASAAARDTEESRFDVASVSSTREGAVFRYTWRGAYDPYWTPREQFEARAVAALEYRGVRGSVKLHGDGGMAGDQGRAFGPDTGTTPLPTFSFPIDFDREYNPYRFGMTLSREIVAGYTLEAAAERSVTVDYRNNSFYVSLVRRR